MKELLDILAAVRRFAADGERMALATIVAVRGSTYRREGARLLLTAGQQMVGNISGGCLESDLMVVADEVMASGAPRLATYDLTADDDAVWGLGLGCNGAVDVFVEPLDPSSRQWTLLQELLAAEETAALAKVVDGPRAGRWMVVRAEGGRTESLGDPVLDERIARASAAAMTEGTSRMIALPGEGGERRVFVEVLRPPVRLIICGAGHDAAPVVQFAAQLGWRTVLVDQRERFLNTGRFPGAQQFIRAEPAEAARAVPLDGRTYVVVMTHNYLHDRDLLRGFLATPVRYIGMLGPRLRTEKILDDLTASGMTITPADRARVYAPIGLDIGGEGPEAIALALLGEIHAVEAGRAGGLLRERQGPIHAPTR
jgi:xanthine/CO dehydrogenase XdhC/CoxF family maturation factor